MVEELLDDPHMLRTDLTASLRGRCVRQLRRQRFTGHRLPRPKQLGLFDPLARVNLRDAKLRRQDIGQRGAAQRFRVGLGGQPVDDLVIHRGQTAYHDLTAPL
jgi:hypothetical protein